MGILDTVWFPLLVVLFYGTGLFLFISAVCSKWYPALQANLNPAISKWVFKYLLNGLIGFGGYLYAHHYLNTLTGVDPNNFPKALVAFTVPFVVYLWLLCIGIGAGLVMLGCMLWLLGVILWNGLVSVLELPFLAGLALMQALVPVRDFVFCVLSESLLTIRNYARCREQFLTTLRGEDYPPKPTSDQLPWLQQKDFSLRALFTYTIGPLTILLCVAFLEQLPQHPPLDRLVHHAATSVLVFADFAYDKTCSASSTTRWVAPLKDRKEQDSPKYYSIN